MLTATPQGKSQSTNTWQEIGCYPETRLAELYTSFVIVWEEMKIRTLFFFFFHKNLLSWSWSSAVLSDNISSYSAWGRDFVNEKVGMLDFMAQP